LSGKEQPATEKNQHIQPAKNAASGDYLGTSLPPTYQRFPAFPQQLSPHTDAPKTPLPLPVLKAPDTTEQPPETPLPVTLPTDTAHIQALSER
jgi:hypothetical protein